MPYIIGTLVERDGRSMRAISLSAGLAGDAVRNLCRQSSKAPRPRTIEAIARVLGVSPAVLRGQAPMPSADDKPQSPSTTPNSVPVPVQTYVEMRRGLRAEIRAAMHKAIAAGMGAQAAVAAGLDEVVAAEIFGSIAI